MIRLVRLVVALESLLKQIVSNRGESADENVIFLNLFARQKQKLVLAFHFLTSADQANTVVRNQSIDRFVQILPHL